MSAAPSAGGRLRAYFEFVIAVIYFFVARGIAHHGALGLIQDDWNPLIEQAMLAFLLLVGYASMGFWLDRDAHPIGSQGFPSRDGLTTEVGMGLATGWGLALVCVLPMVAIGGISIVFAGDAGSWGWLAADAAFFALVTLVEEVAYRGYAFQRFVGALGPIGASIGFAAYYALVQSAIPGSGRSSFAVSLAFSLVLSTAYVRTGALWLSWGLNFGWKASRAILFGLAVNGDSTHSHVIQGDPMGPIRLTGGAFGLDGSWIAFFAMLAAIPVVFRITRELDFRYNAPVLKPGGIPVDLDAAARAQHEAAMGASEPAAPALVQIAGAAPPPVGEDPGTRNT
ncbi:MAG TPA: CPBP family intramembrane glutamic endopeptidase [Terracidiphilus sp.]|nr:CPBP family intramembrane glutamic endopeptidase [Terracidiphilus sp.]